MTHEPIRITVLVDYSAKDGLATEHGFAAWVEAGGGHILFDTGQTGVMQANAMKLGLDIARADMLVLSHGHFDHTGQLPDFLARNATARVYYAHGAQAERYSCKPGTPVRSIGIPESARQALAALPASRVEELIAPRYIAEGIGITGPVPRQSGFEDVGGPFYLDPDSRQDDPIEDDQSMWFETDKGLVILLGCCHAGLVNTVDYIRKVSGEQRVRGIVGGMHLVNANQDRLDKTLTAFQEWCPDFLVPCHCTGPQAVESMLATLGSRTVYPGTVGLNIAIGKPGVNGDASSCVIA